MSRATRHELRTLTKENAAMVAGHLLMVDRLLGTGEDHDLLTARRHAEAAVRRAGRVAVVREFRAVVAYREGDWPLALTEFRTARRLSGSAHLLPLMVDTERAMGRLDRALELAGSSDAARLEPADRIELLIVVSAIRRELGQIDAAAVTLRIPQLTPGRSEPWAARLYYAYAEALLANGDVEGARTWFAHAEAADSEGTDAGDRLDELDGVVVIDLDPDTEDPGDPDDDADGPGDAARDNDGPGDLDRADRTDGARPPDSGDDSGQSPDGAAESGSSDPALTRQTDPPPEQGDPP